MWRAFNEKVKTATETLSQGISYGATLAFGDNLTITNETAPFVHTSHLQLGFPAPLRCFAYDGSSCLLAIGTAEGHVLVYGGFHGCIHLVQLPRRLPVEALVFSPAQRFLSAVTEGPHLFVYDLSVPQDPPFYVVTEPPSVGSAAAALARRARAQGLQRMGPDADADTHHAPWTLDRRLAQTPAPISNLQACYTEPFVYFMRANTLCRLHLVRLQVEVRAPPMMLDEFGKPMVELDIIRLSPDEAWLLVSGALCSDRRTPNQILVVDLATGEVAKTLQVATTLGPLVALHWHPRDADAILASHTNGIAFYTLKESGLKSMAALSKRKEGPIKPALVVDVASLTPPNVSEQDVLLQHVAWRDTKASKFPLQVYLMMPNSTTVVHLLNLTSLKEREFTKKGHVSHTFEFTALQAEMLIGEDKRGRSFPDQFLFLQPETMVGYLLDSDSDHAWVPLTLPSAMGFTQLFHARTHRVEAVAFCDPDDVVYYELTNGMIAPRAVPSAIEGGVEISAARQTYSMMVLATDTHLLHFMDVTTANVCFTFPLEPILGHALPTAVTYANRMCVVCAGPHCLVLRYTPSGRTSSSPASTRGTSQPNHHRSPARPPVPPAVMLPSPDPADGRADSRPHSRSHSRRSLSALAPIDSAASSAAPLPAEDMTEEQLEAMMNSLDATLDDVIASAKAPPEADVARDHAPVTPPASGSPTARSMLSKPLPETAQGVAVVPMNEVLPTVHGITGFQPCHHVIQSACLLNASALDHLLATVDEHGDLCIIDMATQRVTHHEVLAHPHAHLTWMKINYGQGTAYALLVGCSPDAQLPQPPATARESVWALYVVLDHIKKIALPNQRGKPTAAIVMDQRYARVRVHSPFPDPGDLLLLILTTQQAKMMVLRPEVLPSATPNIAAQVTFTSPAETGNVLFFNGEAFLVTKLVGGDVFVAYTATDLVPKFKFDHTLNRAVPGAKLPEAAAAAAAAQASAGSAASVAAAAVSSAAHVTGAGASSPAVAADAPDASATTCQPLERFLPPAQPARLLADGKVVSVHPACIDVASLLRTGGSDVRLMDNVRQGAWCRRRNLLAHNLKQSAPTARHVGAAPGTAVAEAERERQQLQLDRQRAASGGPDGDMTQPTAAASASANPFNRAQAGLQERNERLLNLENKFEELSTGTQEFVDQIRQLATRQAAKKWWQL
ncbi:hypothetical protein CXG81DRAFT_18798 [Caulochytrium protostelioides]|uniref:V-SNARE coiled-coil homology domain-containing protein n=1 Tax=Caulochytrium protostelioides TaxID=1555241 RepID=A0A4P9X7Y8_9FUNG|nr:hypothetical protein CXG81DRAFT_18798 [Caulochytrium protostelioides]|eukprot:RKP01377.1 hypothetical protein CXG81DRAFT_18798 [Caulochytrium protostelioides]